MPAAGKLRVDFTTMKLALHGRVKRVGKLRLARPVSTKQRGRRPMLRKGGAIQDAVPVLRALLAKSAMLPTSLFDPSRGVLRVEAVAVVLGAPNDDEQQPIESVDT